MTPQIEPLKKLFTLEKFQQSFAFYWSIYWRSFVFGALVGLMFGFMSSFLDLALKEEIITSLSPFLRYCIMGLGIALGIVFLLSIAIVTAYILFKTLSKNYKSFNKVFLKGELLEFWSFDFWKVFLRFFGFSIIVFVLLFFASLLLSRGVIFFTGNENFYVHLFCSMIFNYVLNFIIFSIAFHKGLFGFIPVSKGLKNDE